jgi:uncharacterized protein (TIGR03437 family)
MRYFEVKIRGVHLLARNRNSLILSTLFGLAASAVGQIPQYTLATVDTNCSPLSIAVDSTGNVFESCGNLVQRVSVGGTVTSVAGQVAQGANPLSMPFHFYCDSVAGALSGQNEATVLYAGVAPGAVGLYQFNIVVPKLSTTGNTIISYTLGGVQAAQLLILATQ